MSAIGTKPKGEVIFKGPPMQFAQIMESISGRLAKEGGPLVGIWYNQRYPDPSVLKIELTSPNRDTGQLGRLEVLKTGEGKSSVVVAANRDESLFAEWWEPIITEMGRMRLLDTLQPSAPVGHPGLDRNVLVYRLAKAQEAEEIRRSDSNKTWKEIAAEIQWNHGTSKAGVKLLEDARHRLHRLEDSDSDGLLDLVAQWRKTKEM